MALLVAAVTALVAVASGCGSSKSRSERSSTTAASTTAPSTTAAPTKTSSATGPPARSTVGYPTNQEAAQHLIDAWQNGDRASALQGADPSAVATMFAIPVGELNVRGCDDGSFPTSSCVYRLYSNQYEIRIDMEKRSVGWVVNHVNYSAP